MGENQVHDGPFPGKKKSCPKLPPNSSMPLRHIEVIVIWEGNYNSDTFYIGIGDHFLYENQCPAVRIDKIRFL